MRKRFKFSMIIAEDGSQIIHASGGSVTVEAAAADGAFPKFSANSYNGGKLTVKGYPFPVVVDLDHLQGLNASHVVYREHNHERILGAGKTIRAGNSLQTTGEFTNDTPDVQEVVRLGKAAHPFEASVGVAPLGLIQVAKGKSAMVNGQMQEGPFLIARPAKLKEVSVVNHGSDDTTSLVVVASDPVVPVFGGSSMDFAQYLASLGLVEASLTPAAITALRSQFDASQEPTPGAGVADVLAAARARETRHAAYGRIVASAIDRGMSTTDAERLVEAAQRDDLGETEFELQVLRASRGGVSRDVASRSPQLNAAVIEAALARSNGVDLEVSGYRPEMIEAATEQFRHGLSVVELMQMQAARNGFGQISSRNIDGLLRGAFAPVHASATGPSTYSLGSILSNVINKEIRAAFMAVEAEWRKIATIGSASDMRPITVYSMGGDLEYQELGHSGEIKHGTLSDSNWQVQAKTYARMLMISEDDLLNDDLGVLGRARTLLGRGAGLKFNKLFWAAYLAGVAASFWSAAKKNMFGGASTALDIASLSKARQAFGKLTDPDGNKLGAMPALLVVPSALSIYAGQLMTDKEIRMTGDGTTNQTYTTSNPHVGKCEVASSVYLDADTNVAGSSDEQWWLNASPQEFETISVRFYNGQQEPTVQDGQAHFDQLGIGFRGVHRFGIGLGESLASIRMAGK